MTELTTPPSNVSSSWRTLAEFQIPDRADGEGKFAQIKNVLEQVGLNSMQVNHIQGTLFQTLQNVEDTHTPLNMRISFKKGIVAEFPGKIFEDTQTIEASETGLGFFVVKRFIQQSAEEPEKAGRFVLEVLIYSER